jgi:hypothetical protein
MVEREFYASREWKGLDPLNRACILLVSEGLKPGSTFGSTYRVGVERILEQLRIPYLPPEWHGGDYIYTIAKDDKTLSDYIRKLLDKNLTSRQAHRAHGIFYGIPECCINEYIGATVLNGKSPGHRKTGSFDELLKKYEKLNGRHHEDLDYRIPGITPCKVDCSNALKAFQKYKDVLLQYDKEAADELKLFNKLGYRILRQ